MKIKANADNIKTWLNGMARFNSTPDFGTTRILFTKPEIKNREYVKAEMKALGLEVKEDAIGNIFAVLKGEDETLSPVWTGSHIDTVPNAGNFDGMAGVVCGMEALRIIRENNLKHKRDIYVNVYTSEEPTRYGLSCLGSRALAGELHLEDTKKLFDQDEKSLYEKLVELGYDTSKFKDIPRKQGQVFATVELHVEQNNRLEQGKKSIGMVKSICAPSNYTITVYGVQSHAGGTSMEERRDAFMAVSEMALSLEQLAKNCPSEYNTATIGVVKVIPGGVNVIPGQVEFSVDIRDCTKDTKDTLIRNMFCSFDKIANKRGVTYEVRKENDDVPLVCDPKIVKLIQKKCDRDAISYETLISGPYHDTLFIGRFAPSAMIFVPSRNGISHSPEEWTDYEELKTGADILSEVLLDLANLEEI